MPGLSGTVLPIVTGNFLDSVARCWRWISPRTVPSAMLNAANRVVMPCRAYSWVRRPGMPGIIGSTGWDRSRAWIWDFSSTHSTTARSGVVQTDDVDDLLHEERVGG